jgi:hypothetical protein
MRVTTPAIVFVIALVARGAMFVMGPLQDPSRAVTEDSGLYLVLARGLVEAGEFGVVPDQRSSFDQFFARLESGLGAPALAPAVRVPETFRTPGYPLFLAVTSLGMRDFRPVLVIQCLFGALAAALVVLLARRVGAPGWVAAAAGLVWALHPALVVFDNLLLTESLFNLLVVAAVFLGATAQSGRRLVWAGVLLGCATLVRPPLALVFIPALWAFAWPVRALRRGVAVATVCAVAIPGSWVLRNVAVGAGPTLSRVGDYSMIFYTAPCAVSESKGEDCDRAYPTRYREMADRLARQLKPADDVVAAARSQALGDIAANGEGALRMYGKSLAKVAVAHSMGTFASTLGMEYQPSGLFARLVLGERSDSGGAGVTPMLLALAWSAFNAALFALAGVGFALALWRRRFDVALAFGVIVAALCAAVGAVGQERVRLPMMLPLLMLATVVFSPRGAQTGRVA